MLPLLSVGVAVMTLSLNLNGYVKDPHSPIFVAQLAKFAKPVSLSNFKIVSLCSATVGMLVKWSLFLWTPFTSSIESAFITP